MEKKYDSVEQRQIMNTCPFADKECIGKNCMLYRFGVCGIINAEKENVCANNHIAMEVKKLSEDNSRFWNELSAGVRRKVSFFGEELERHIEEVENNISVIAEAVREISSSLKSDWISVKRALPDKDETCWVLHKDKTVDKGKNWWTKKNGADVIAWAKIVELPPEHIFVDDIEEGEDDNN